MEKVKIINNYTWNLSNFVYHKRRDKEFTFSELAERAGVSEATVKRLEYQDGGVTWDSALKIIDALGETLASYEIWVE